MSKIMVLNGPNLNLLGTREPELYGSETLETINHRIRGLIEAEGHEFVAFQSNAEHELVDKIHLARHDTCLLYTSPSPRDRG